MLNRSSHYIQIRGGLELRLWLWVLFAGKSKRCGYSNMRRAPRARGDFGRERSAVEESKRARVLRGMQRRKVWGRKPGLLHFWISKTPIGRSAPETSAKPSTESFDLCDPSADDNMERTRGTKESSNVSIIQKYFSHFLFSSNPMFRNSSRFDLSYFSLHLHPLPTGGLHTQMASDQTAPLLRSKLSPSKIHLFYRNLKNLDSLNLDLFHQDESNTLGNYLKESGMKIEQQKQIRI